MNLFTKVAIIVLIVFLASPAVVFAWPSEEDFHHCSQGDLDCDDSTSVFPQFGSVPGPVQGSMLEPEFTPQHASGGTPEQVGGGEMVLQIKVASETPIGE